MQIVNRPRKEGPSKSVMLLSHNLLNQSTDALAVRFFEFLVQRQPIIRQSLFVCLMIGCLWPGKTTQSSELPVCLLTGVYHSSKFLSSTLVISRTRLCTRYLIKLSSCMLPSCILLFVLGRKKWNEEPESNASSGQIYHPTILVMILLASLPSCCSLTIVSSRWYSSTFLFPLNSPIEPFCLVTAMGRANLPSQSSNDYQELGPARNNMEPGYTAIGTGRRDIEAANSAYLPVRRSTYTKFLLLHTKYFTTVNVPAFHEITHPRFECVSFSVLTWGF